MVHMLCAMVLWARTGAQAAVVDRMSMCWLFSCLCQPLERAKIIDICVNTLVESSCKDGMHARTEHLKTQPLGLPAGLSSCVLHAEYMHTAGAAAGSM